MTGGERHTEIKHAGYWWTVVMRGDEVVSVYRVVMQKAAALAGSRRVRPDGALLDEIKRLATVKYEAADPSE